MKLSLTGDFTTLPRAQTMRRANEAAADAPLLGTISLAHDERHLRRKVLTLDTGEQILVDLPESVQLAHGDRLVLEDGREVEILAAEEALLEIVPRDALHLSELAWHIGNRHLAAEIGSDRILILRDHVMAHMLEGLGAALREVAAPFHPLRGAYGGHGHSHHHG
ncbi:MAG TPA: urease accessory protein UreE [Mesorhizobium sp.]|jgi:urease accessory protein|nr:urease accessory protein UreE [Mesorhizobium sp.]